MAFNFDSGQFNKESTAKRLGNWEVPRWSPTRARPANLRPDPTPICDKNGHFLPGAPKGKSRCFGHYVGTWDLPKKITREVAQQLAKEPPDSRFADWLNPRVQRSAKSGRMREGKRGKIVQETICDEQNYKDNREIEHNIDIINEHTETDQLEDNDRRINDVLEWNKQKDPVDKDGHGPYVPGSLTEPEKRHDSYDLLVKKAVEEVHGPQEDETEKFWRKVNENSKENDDDMKIAKNKKGQLKLPSVNASQHFQFARKMHVDNLEHQPLPDTLGYRNLTKIAEHRDSDIIVKPYAIGWKGYGASGPTCCTKMRVHRPKTCDVKKSDTEGADGKQRPSSSVPEFGREFTKPMTHMDLAIRWDYRPNDPKQEPKRPKHIDGSNGSKAPAVFTMVHTPKEPEDLTKSGHSNPIFNQNRLGEDLGHHPVPYFEKDMSKDKRKDSCDVQYCTQHNNKKETTRSNSSNASRRNSAKCDGIHGCGTPSESSVNTKPVKLEKIKQAWNSSDKLSDIRNGNNSIESYDKTPLAQGKLHQSSPNDSQIPKASSKNSDTFLPNNNKYKHCISCNRTSKPILEEKVKDHFKLAFKAGNPNSVQSSNTSQDSKNLKIPKMRPPYTKKTYTIPTLAPPFSIWRDENANGYPEHWRLASVYQHAYKPPEQRRKTLISSVYQ